MRLIKNISPILAVILAVSALAWHWYDLYESICAGPLAGRTINLCVDSPKNPDMYIWIESSLAIRSVRIVPDCVSPTVRVTISILPEKTGLRWMADIATRDKNLSVAYFGNRNPRSSISGRSIAEKIAKSLEGTP